jgi:hypothetical protein
MRKVKRFEVNILQLNELGTADEGPWQLTSHTFGSNGGVLRGFRFFRLRNFTKAGSLFSARWNTAGKVEFLVKG